MGNKAADLKSIQDRAIDEALDESFPASDPPAWMLGETAQQKARPAQHQEHQPGKEYKMQPPPQSFMKDYKAAGKLEGKTALVSGGDSGIGRAICIGFAKEGADVAFIYLEEDKDAQETVRHIEAEGRKALPIKGDISDKSFCTEAVEKAVRELGRLNIFVNNAAEQHEHKDLQDIPEDELKRTFATNIFGMFFLTQAALKYLKADDCIINTASIVAYRGHETLLDYSSTKGAVVGFTRALSANLASKGIRVNAVAPGPIWTPLIPASFEGEKVAEFGKSAPLGRAGQPDEVAPSFIFLASDDASYITGQVIHPNGGTIVGS